VWLSTRSHQRAKHRSLVSSLPLQTTKYRLGIPSGAGAPGNNWQLMARSTAPEFGAAAAQHLLDHVQLGVLIGAGSFGRVYKGRWQGRDVAVKVRG